jgi:hypothetical protein
MVSGWERKPPLPRVIISEIIAIRFAMMSSWSETSIGRHEDVFVNYRYILNFSEYGPPDRICDG